MTDICQNCGGPLKELKRRSGWRDGAYIKIYRCKGDCRGGGHTTHPDPSSEATRRVGPIFHAGAAHTVHGPEAEHRVRTDGGVTVATTDLDSIVPGDVRERQREAFAELEDGGLWCTDIPVCLHCGAANTCAYGGKPTLEVGDYTLVAETCHECETETVQVLEVDR